MKLPALMQQSFIVVVIALSGSVSALSSTMLSYNHNKCNEQLPVVPVESGTGTVVASRRSALIKGGAALSFFAAAAFPATASAATDTASAFVGTYADPVNHPGGKRTVRLVGTAVGDYQLAEVHGGGGRGEPDNYVLPAVILGGRTIIIDFSVAPKYGPKDFVGVLDKKTNGIKFLRDGNLWPRTE